MTPDDSNKEINSSSQQLPNRYGSIQPAERSRSAQDAAAQLVRTQIDSIYTRGDSLVTQKPQQENTQPVEIVDAYNKTHTDHVDPQAEQWKQYHSAWQTYYQKYYEGYYSHHLHKAQEALQAHAVAANTQGTETTYFSHEPEPVIEAESLSKDEALFDLRKTLIGRVKNSAKKVRKSRHFVPITAGVIVVLIFAFLQYNQLLIANVMAYVSPGSINPQNLIVDPSQDVQVGPDPELIIPKINVDVPVSYDIGNDYNSQMAAMAKGLAWFGVPGADSHPGEVGNTVLAGHSSNDLLDKGDYKFIFAQLGDLTAGDTIYANYKSVRYTYVVTGTSVVSPTSVSALVYATNKPILTLLTCTPVGTSKNRLLVTAEQVSPDPSTATKAASSASTSAAPASIPGTGSTVFEKLFGANG